MKKIPNFFDFMKKDKEIESVKNLEKVISNTQRSNARGKMQENIIDSKNKTEILKENRK